MEEFELRSYSRKELSLLYFPTRSPEGASQAFGKWLKENEDKNPELLRSIKNKKEFPRTLVRQIIALLGEP